ncbi:DUF349 domain-containing protein [Corticibacter populi]|uniref:DUF349 domain-containing protein n=1 Tax=Corticibacter populi TaxID=1550736 RepID=A0A3M6QXY9_9BURK|nr:DUF349 domain-containing protein [Corticibacter populi]RMX07877.1 DUF349 domain-containing protein [Corticibacter populi]RZS35117.1 uncharacterized protein DUF349 [Corticibacter populi]
MFAFLSRNKTPAEPDTPPTAPAEPQAPHPLDALSGGVFSAANSAERQLRVEQWLASQPDMDSLQKVYKALSARDKGAAKPIRQRMNDIRQDKQQEATSQDWAAKAEKILAAPTFHLADGMAWQRDAAKAGAPLSKEPLASLRGRIAEAIKSLEDLQHKAMVQKEAAVLLAQRIDVLSTKPWQHAAEAAAGLAQDIDKWRANAAELTGAALWSSVEPRHANALQSSETQLVQVFEAFSEALAQAKAAAEDPKAPLPKVQVWADELRALHGHQEVPAAVADAPAAAPLSPEQLAGIETALAELEASVKSGQAKQSNRAAAALREQLKAIGGVADAGLEQRINRALIDAGDLQGWQRWGANQVREELIARAEKLLQPESGRAVAAGKQLQTLLRELREQWRQVDRSSPPNAHLWKRFDEAANKAHAVVEEWLGKVKAETQAHKAERQALIDELQQWGQAHAQQAGDDLKGSLKDLQRGLQQFANRWRNAGHVSDKLYTQLQEQWKSAYDAVAAPLDQARKASVAARRALIAEAQELAAAAELDINAVKRLQQRWQAEAQGVPLERKLEQKLWDSFRQPLDAAFNRKSEQRSKASAALSAHDQAVLQAAEQLEQASHASDAAAIRAAMDALEQAVRQVPATPGAGAPAARADATAATNSAEADAAVATGADTAPAAESNEPAEVPEADESPAADSTPAPVAPPPPAAKPVIAVRGDDRPGAQRRDAAVAASAAKGSTRPGPRDRERRPERPERVERAERGNVPRLGDKAFRAQRQALEAAQQALRKLSSQAHGEALVQLLEAWRQRDAAALPPASQLGKRVSASQWSAWQTALGAPATASAGAAQALLRLEIAAEVPTPAEALIDRRALQLQLLTQKHAATPLETWQADTAQVLAGAADDASARRLQAALKALLKR